MAILKKLVIVWPENLCYSISTLVINQGKITHQGTYDLIMESCENISSFVTEDKEIEDEINNEKPKITGKVHFL